MEFPIDNANELAGIRIFISCHVCFNKALYVFKIKYPSLVSISGSIFFIPSFIMQSVCNLGLISVIIALKHSASIYQHAL